MSNSQVRKPGLYHTQTGMLTCLRAEHTSGRFAVIIESSQQGGGGGGGNTTVPGADSCSTPASSHQGVTSVFSIILTAA